MDKGWSNIISFLELSACQLQAVEKFFFAVVYGLNRGRILFGVLGVRVDCSLKGKHPNDQGKVTGGLGNCGAVQLRGNCCCKGGGILLNNGMVFVLGINVNGSITFCIGIM